MESSPILQINVNLNFRKLGLGESLFSGNKNISQPSHHIITTHSLKKLKKRLFSSNIS